MSIYSTLQEPSNNTNVTIATSSTKVSDARNELNPRKVITLRNISTSSTDVITINFGNNPAVANQGIVLRQYESITDSSESGYTCWQGSITAISTTGTSLNLAVFER